MGVLTGRTERRQWAPEPVIPPYPGAPVPGQPTFRQQPDGALMIPTVWACTTLLANSVSMLPLETFRRVGPNGVPNRIADPQLVSEPADGMTQSEWLHMLMVSLLLRGNAFGKIAAKDAYLRPTQIELMNPDQVHITVDRQTGELTYKIGPTLKEADPASIWHVRGMTLPGTKIGLSPISYAAMTLGVDMASRKFAADFYDGGGIPKAVLQTDMDIQQEQARTLKERLLAATRNREPVVLGNGVKYQAISVKPEESQFLATQQASVSQIARYFGVPPEMVGGPSGNSMTYSNVEQRSLDFLTYGVAFWLKRIEDAFFPLLPSPQYVKFRVEDLLRTDAHTRAQVDMFEIASKVRTPTEVRSDHGWPPMTDAQKAEADMVPLGIGPLGRPTATPALKELPGPVAPTPANDEQGAPNG